MATAPISKDHAHQYGDVEVDAALVEVDNHPLARLARARRGFSRNDVIGAFAQTFEQIGGASRFAAWADRNPTEFFKLYAKLLPSSTVNVQNNTKVVVNHKLPRTQLDMVTDVTITLPDDDDE